ncbi:MAG: hypothetical protein LHV69_03380 [Elusimicrobia bacterium]|nr:hypothetical protein [Candidatus Obscuribacterium magneticum]
MPQKIKKYVVTDEQICPQCGTANPHHAYCCLNCFKVLREKPKVPFWKMEIRLDLLIIVAVFVVFAGMALLFKQWLTNVEAEVTLNLTSAEYNVSVVADKRKRSASLELKKGGNDSDSTSTPTDDSAPK